MATKPRPADRSGA